MESDAAQANVLPQGAKVRDHLFIELKTRGLDGFFGGRAEVEFPLEYGETEPAEGTADRALYDQLQIIRSKGIGLMKMYQSFGDKPKYEDPSFYDEAAENAMLSISKIFAKLAEEESSREKKIVFLTLAARELRTWQASSRRVDHKVLPLPTHKMWVVATKRWMALGQYLMDERMSVESLRDVWGGAPIFGDYERSRNSVLDPLGLTPLSCLALTKSCLPTKKVSDQYIKRFTDNIIKTKNSN